MTHDWNDAARRAIKTELARAGWTLERLARELNAMGLNESTDSVRNKIHRGAFPATFLLQVMAALRRRQLDVSDFYPEEIKRDLESGRTHMGEAHVQSRI